MNTNLRTTRSMMLAAVSLAVLAVAAVALMSPHASSADDYFGYDHDYQGKLERGNFLYFGFDYRKTGKNKGKISRISVITPLHCADSDNTFFLVIRIHTKLKVKNGKLSIRNKKVKFRVSGSPQEISGKLTLTGKFKGGKANGKYQLSTRDGGDLCTFGVLKWRAKRGATVTIPI